MSQLVTALKEEGQDFEWYPTTDEIIQTVKSDLVTQNIDGHASILDCGAGDGRVLQALTEGKRYAIEKSKPLLSRLDKSVFVVGTEFAEQTLLDKSVDVVFSNPPYSQYEAWVYKIISEARAKLVYLVIPERWENNETLQKAVVDREAEVKVLGSFDFLNAERSARAKVHIVRLDLQGKSARRHSYYRRGGSKVDPFSLWFNQNFEIGAQNKSKEDYEKRREKTQTVKESVQNALVQGDDVVSCLENMYSQQLDKIIANYKKLEELDDSLLSELDVSISGLQESLHLKIKNLKDMYWRELFDNLSKVTDRLTKKSRETLLDTLTANTQVDFTIGNAHAVLEWVVKNANGYLEDQLIYLVERMMNESNIIMYKSNQRTFGKEEWRYGRTPHDLDRFKLDLRIVMSCGGINTGFWGDKSDIAERAAFFLDDVCAVANNLGFDTQGQERARSFQWLSGKKNVFHFTDHKDGKSKPLMEVKAYKNGNLHIKFNQVFMCKLNVEFGRLKGWLKTAEQAADEVQVPERVAQACFNSHKLLTSSSLPALGLKSNAA